MIVTLNNKTLEKYIYFSRNYILKYICSYFNKTINYIFFSLKINDKIILYNQTTIGEQI